MSKVITWSCDFCDATATSVDDAAVPGWSTLTSTLTLQAVGGAQLSGVSTVDAKPRPSDLCPKCSGKLRPLLGKTTPVNVLEMLGVPKHDGIKGIGGVPVTAAIAEAAAAMQKPAAELSKAIEAEREKREEQKPLRLAAPTPLKMPGPQKPRLLETDDKE